MHLVEQGRQLLDLVDDDEWMRAGPDHVLQLARSAAQPQEVIRLEQVDDQGLFAELRSNEEALSRGARAQQEERLLAQETGKLQDAGVAHGLILCDAIK